LSGNLVAKPTPLPTHLGFQALLDALVTKNVIKHKFTKASGRP